MKKFKLLLTSTLIALVFVSTSQVRPAPLKMVQFLLSPDHSDWNYELKENASINVSITKFGIVLNDVEIEYEFGPEMMPAEKKGVIKLKDGSAKINIGTLKEPGFKQLIVKATDNDTEYRDAIKVAFAPAQIEPTVKLPDDFDAYWKQALEANAKIPIDAIVTHKPEYSTSNVDVYLVSLQNYKIGKRLYGYLCKPKAEGKYPVLFHPPGAGVKNIVPSTYFADMGFISLTIEVHGLSPEISKEDYTDIRNAFGDYWLDKLDDKANYYYKSVYVGCVRSIDFLTGLPEFDGKNVLVKGGSQGGALSIVTAGLDKRVSCLAAFYPALCDISGYLYGRAGGWPHMFQDKYQKINATPEKINTASYFDVVNFARKIWVPGFYSFGYNDFTCPPTSVLSAINVITAPKKIVVTPISGHWRFGDSDKKSNDWLLRQCGIDKE